MQPVKPGRGSQPGGWDNAYAYPLIISRRVEAALIRFMADKGWYHKGKALNYLLEESLVSRRYLERAITPEEMARQERQQAVQSALDSWEEMNEDARTHYRLKYQEITADMIASAREKKMALLRSQWAEMRSELRAYWAARFPELSQDPPRLEAGP